MIKIKQEIIKRNKIVFQSTINILNSNKSNNKSMKHNSNFSPSKSVKSMRKSRPIPHKEEIVMKSDSSESELEYVVEEFNTSESEPFEIKVSKPEEDKLSEVLVNTISKRHSIYNNLDNFLTENAKESEEFKKEKMIQSLLQDWKFKPSKNIFNIPRTNRNRINQWVTPNCLNTSKSKGNFIL